MAVTISYNKGSGKFYDVPSKSIPISFSSLRNNFKEENYGQIKASELLRNTSNAESNPIVPNSTENSTISSLQNWKVSQFYGGKVKYYDIIQSGTDDNVSINSNYGINISEQSWNSNLNKNINKVFYVDGTIGSITATKSAAYFNAEAYNFQIYLRNGGQILGAGGARNSGVGGNALYVNSSGSGETAKIIITLDEGSSIKSGGGGGARGADGWTGPNGPCWVRREYTKGSDCNCEWYPSCENPNTPITINNVTYNSRDARKIGGNRGTGGCACFIWCRKTCISKTECEVYDPKVRVGGPGGIGGNGGLGQGYNQTKTDAIATLNATNGPTSGTPANCPTYATTGENGKSGGNGGDWAKQGGKTARVDIQNMINAYYVSPASGYNGSDGGNPGRAVTGSNYQISGRTDLILGAK